MPSACPRARLPVGNELLDVGVGVPRCDPSRDDEPPADDGPAPALRLEGAAASRLAKIGQVDRIDKIDRLDLTARPRRRQEARAPCCALRVPRPAALGRSDRVCKTY